jgi:hypothetical protein
VAALALALGFTATTRAAAEEGVALAIIYDTSGSMAEPVPAGPGTTAPKYVIANKALGNIVDRIERFATNGSAQTPRKVEAGLYVFRKGQAAAAVPFGPLDAQAFRKWVGHFSRPNGDTPLGRSIEVAAKAVLASPLNHKHIVVITDGMNTAGPDPQTVINKITQGGDHNPSGLAFHFVAFDVDASVFAGVKSLGATVVPAANEQQLNARLEYIFEKKILLEDEEPKSPAPAKTN